MTKTTQPTPTLRKAWLDAMRPRTLPLALSCIALGTFLATADHAYSWPITTLCLLTAVFLQILSNLANDYGDSIHGADHVQREGPQRAVQSGQISAATMKRAMILFAGLSGVSGLLLLWLAFGAEGRHDLGEGGNTNLLFTLPVGNLIRPGIRVDALQDTGDRGKGPAILIRANEDKAGKLNFRLVLSRKERE